MIVTDKNGKKYNLEPIEEESTDNLTYLDILKELKPTFFISYNNTIVNGEGYCNNHNKNHNLLTSEKECQRLQVKTKLQNLAAYFNNNNTLLNDRGYWNIELSIYGEPIAYKNGFKNISIDAVKFIHKEDCQKAIEILGDELKILFE